MKKIILLIGVVLLTGVALFVFAYNSRQSANNSGKIKIVTTLFPLYDMAKHIGGDFVEVSLLLPPGVEPHAFEPKPSDIIKINNADIFVYTGKFMEPWAADVINGVSNKKLIIVDSSEGIKLEGSDPHIWMDFDNAKKMADNIENAIERVSPKNISFFKSNLDKYNLELSNLDNQFKTGLASCSTKEIIYGGHYAFGYLVNRYGLKYFAAQGLSPDSEPTAKDLTNLVDQIRSQNIKYIFYEELSSPKIAETLANETSAKMLLLNAAHNLSKNDFESGMTFFDILQSDLKNLKVGLECK